MKVGQNHRIVNQVMVIAIGVDTTRRCHIQGFELGASEGAALWLQFFRYLVHQGLKGMQFVILLVGSILFETIQLILDTELAE